MPSELAVHTADPSMVLNDSMAEKEDLDRMAPKLQALVALRLGLAQPHRILELLCRLKSHPSPGRASTVAEERQN